jgi:diaminopimelate decarboxylase
MGFAYTDTGLCAERVSFDRIAARFGTPCYVYSRRVLEERFKAYDAAFGRRAHRICYSVKANGNIALLNLLARLGAGFDIVSGGELQRVIAAGGDPGQSVFSGVGKTADEIKAALGAGIGCINVESEAELELIAELAAELGVRAPLSVRVNPDVDANTHPYIATGLRESKFGVPIDAASDIYERAAALPQIEVVGVACHIGSQLTELAPLVDALTRVVVLVGVLQRSGLRLTHIDAGGGLGIGYGRYDAPAIESYVEAITATIGSDFEIVIEPGRSMVGPAGVLLTTVQYVKRTPAKTFAICDAAMSELIRPALYQAEHEVLPVRQPSDGAAGENIDLVGPVCETADFLARDRNLALESGDRLAIMDAGAYGFVMASNYNARPRPPELLVDGDAVHVIRERETISELFAREHLIGAN